MRGGEGVPPPVPGLRLVSPSGDAVKGEERERGLCWAAPRVPSPSPHWWHRKERDFYGNSSNYDFIRNIQNKFFFLTKQERKTTVLRWKGSCQHQKQLNQTNIFVSSNQPLSIQYSLAKTPSKHPRIDLYRHILIEHPHLETWIKQLAPIPRSPWSSRLCLSNKSTIELSSHTWRMETMEVCTSVG
jgi:hypothetical protein